MICFTRRKFPTRTDVPPKCSSRATFGSKWRWIFWQMICYVHMQVERTEWPLDRSCMFLMGSFVHLAFQPTGLHQTSRYLKRTVSRATISLTENFGDRTRILFAFTGKYDEIDLLEVCRALFVLGLLAREDVQPCALWHGQAGCTRIRRRKIKKMCSSNDDFM